MVPTAAEPNLHERIFTIRGERVILDSDLAEIYGVEVRTLNQQVKRNTACALFQIVEYDHLKKERQALCRESGKQLLTCNRVLVQKSLYVKTMAD